VRFPSEPRAARQRRARAALGLPADATVAALAGPVCRPDGALATFLSAGSSLCHARPNALLLLPSPKPGAEREVSAAMARHAGALRANSRVTTLPPELEERLLYDAADIVSYGAHPNALPLGLLTTMAAGAAAVAADQPLVREFASDRADAVLYPSGDAEALALVLLALADDPQQRETLALAGVARARDHYDALDMAAVVGELEGELTGR
jgi:phosphatidylinositol alpha-mannosyltransferase